MATEWSRQLASMSNLARAGASSRASLRMRVIVPITLVAATVLAADLLRWVFPAGGVFMLLLVPVLFVSIALGVLAGLVALVSGMTGAWLMVVLRSHPWLTEPTDLLRIVPYVFIGGFLIIVAWTLRGSVAHSTNRTRDVESPLIEPLTAREREVLALAASGLSVRGIARRLCVSPNTVKSHLAHAYGKLGAHNRAEAVAAALHSGTLDDLAVTARAAEITEAVTLSSKPANRGPEQKIRRWSEP